MNDVAFIATEPTGCKKVKGAIAVLILFVGQFDRQMLLFPKEKIPSFFFEHCFQS